MEWLWIVVVLLVIAAAVLISDADPGREAKGPGRGGELASEAW
jgi:hypothetical protein